MLEAPPALATKGQVSMATTKRNTRRTASQKWTDTAQARRPTLYNGYIHPGPYSDKKSDPPQFPPPMPKPSGCQCAACLIFGPAYCKAHVTHIADFFPVPTAAEEAAERQQAHQRQQRRLQLITEQAAKAEAAGHCPERIAKAAAIARDPTELVLSMAKYFAGPTACKCPDATHGRGRKCKHVLAHIISANVERRIERQPQEPTATAEVETKPAEVAAQPAPPLVTSPYKRMLARRAQERIEAQAQEKEKEQEQSEPAARPSDKFMPFEPEISRDAQGMIWS